MNLCAYHKIRVWNLMQKGNKLEMNLSVKDFYGLKKICQKTHTRIKITGKYGLPFFFYRNKKRKAFFIGIFIGFFSAGSSFPAYLEHSCRGKYT